MAKEIYNVSVESVTREDIPSLTAIYNHYIRQTTVSFEEDPINEEALSARIEKVQAAGLPWLVAKQESRVLGYAYACPWRARSAYRYSVEVSVYVDKSHQGKGIGTGLYSTLFAQLEALNIHTLVAGITLPNAASIALHEKLGLTKSAHFSEIGKKFGTWLDVGYWQKTL